MRASELLDLTIVDAEGTRRGKVLDIRTRVDRDVDGAPILLVDGLIVGTRHWRLFGYERRGEQGPALLRGLARRVNRETRYIAIDQLDLTPPAARLRVPWHSLPTLPELAG
jgi:hypothetical protein